MGFSPPSDALPAIYTAWMLGRMAFFLFVLFAHEASSVSVTPNSPCQPVCQGAGRSIDTSNQDITCRNTGYGTTLSTIRWQNCMTCLQNSTFSAGDQTDLAWFLCKPVEPSGPLSPMQQHPSLTDTWRRQPTVCHLELPILAEQCDGAGLDAMCHVHRVRKPPARLRAREPEPDHHDRVWVLREQRQRHVGV